MLSFEDASAATLSFAACCTNSKSPVALISPARALLGTLGFAASNSLLSVGKSFDDVGS